MDVVNFFYGDRVQIVSRSRVQDGTTGPGIGLDTWVDTVSSGSSQVIEERLKILKRGAPK